MRLHVCVPVCLCSCLYVGGCVCVSFGGLRFKRLLKIDVDMCVVCCNGFCMCMHAEVPQDVLRCLKTSDGVSRGPIIHEVA